MPIPQDRGIEQISTLEAFPHGDLEFGDSFIRRDAIAGVRTEITVGAV